jgi:hypothetical protein
MIHTTTKKAADATNANGLHTTLTSADFLTGVAIEQATNDAEIAAGIAFLVPAGHTVPKGNTVGFTVCKYGLAKQCQDFGELQAFSRKLGLSR